MPSLPAVQAFLEGLEFGAVGFRGSVFGNARNPIEALLP